MPASKSVDKKYKGSCTICGKSLFSDDAPIMVKSRGKTRYYCLDCYKKYYGKPA